MTNEDEIHAWWQSQGACICDNPNPDQRYPGVSPYQVKRWCITDATLSWLRENAPQEDVGMEVADIKSTDAIEAPRAF